jgi:hypothetical protein
LAPAPAAERIAMLMNAARMQKISGVSLRTANLLT